MRVYSQVSWVQVLRGDKHKEPTEKIVSDDQTNWRETYFISEDDEKTKIFQNSALSHHLEM